MGEPIHEIDPARAAYVRALAPYLLAMGELADAKVAVEAYLAMGGAAPPPVVGAVGRAEANLARVILEAQTTADIAARRDVLAAADRLAGGVSPPVPPGPVASPAVPSPGGGGPLPEVPFTEASADIIAREPRLAHGAREVSKVYNSDHGFAMARSSSLEVTARVQTAVADAIQTGVGIGDASASIQTIARKAGEDMAKWTRSYAETVMRTNVATAYSAGRFRQMAEPSVQRAIGALRYSTVGDVDVRENHQAADGVVAAADDPIWQSMAPPLGYNCRCGVDFVSWPELERMGLIESDGRVRRARAPAGAHADEGFRHTGRPDILIYGGGI